MTDDRVYAIVFGRVLSKLRERKGMSQAVLAKQALVAQGTLSRIEAGRLRPDVVTARRLSMALGVSSEEFASKVEAAMQRARSYAAKVAEKPAGGGSLEGVVALAGAVGLVAVAMLAVGALFENDEPPAPRRRRKARPR